MIKEEVDEDDIADGAFALVHIPVEKLKADESQKLIDMESELHKRVIGQDEAITKISDTIRIHRSGLPIQTNRSVHFCFLDQPVLVKLKLPKLLADYLFNDEHKMIRIDMSEYMEKHAVARLIGAPPGYVGYEEGGQLTEAVRKNPYSVILFDEIEKAHPDVFNIFLQILDEGHLTDSQGRTVSFKNCIIIMTSNIGSDLILAAGDITEKVRKEIDALLFKFFRPELLNRIDEVVFFKSLNQKDVEQIVNIQLDYLKDRLREKNIELEITSKAIQALAELGYQKEFGARPLKRAVQHYVVSPLSIEILKNPDKKLFTIDAKKDQIVIN